MKELDLSDGRLASYREYVKDTESTDDEIRDALRRARQWVGRLRYSDSIVAHNILKDGYPHA